MELIDKALQIASRAHRNQNRKGTDIPYISHPAAVGMILLKAGYKEEVVVAGILHDTVEDTELDLKDIELMFGARITEIVEGCSEPDKELSWEKRKEHTLEFLKTASKEIRAVACADKLHNIRSIIKDYKEAGEAVWTRFNRGREQQEWYYRNLVESLGYASGFKLLEKFQDEVERLFGNGEYESRLRLSNQTINLLFETIYSISNETAHEIEKQELNPLVRELHERSHIIRENKFEKIEKTAAYLSQRGVQFAQSEGTEILLAFCVALKEKLHFYDYELYQHFNRNAKRGVL